MILQGIDSINGLLVNKNVFLVCDKVYSSLDISKIIDKYNTHKFLGFSPNPKYEEVFEGLNEFNKEEYNVILAVGGGSAIDVAKCIKYYSKKNIDLIAIPTTAGTGSESTHFAVIYKEGKKQSISDDSLLPTYAILEPSVLKSVPDYIRKTTMLDALCHDIESYWSKKSTNESKEFSIKSINIIKEYMDSYLKNEEIGNKNMMLAANLAGQAINITTTTAAHAMAYKLTSIYGIAHGHACAICLPEVWKRNNVEIPGITIDEFNQILNKLDINKPKSNNREKDIEILVESVNLERLSNNPVSFNKDIIKEMYEEIVK